MAIASFLLMVPMLINLEHLFFCVRIPVNEVCTMQDKRKTTYNGSYKGLIRCAWCDASLPADKAFQELHMLRVHGLVV